MGSYGAMEGSSGMTNEDFARKTSSVTQQPTGRESRNEMFSYEKFGIESEAEDEDLVAPQDNCGLGVGASMMLNNFGLESDVEEETDTAQEADAAYPSMEETIKEHYVGQMNVTLLTVVPCILHLRSEVVEKSPKNLPCLRIAAILEGSGYQNYGNIRMC